MITFKVFGGTGNEQFYGLSVSKMGHISFAGRATSTTPRMSYSTWTSLFFMKTDVSLGDSDCWVTKSITFDDKTSAFKTAWTQITTAEMVIHSQIGSNDKTTTFSYKNWVRNTDYYLFSFCSIPTSIPDIPDKWI